MKQWFALCKTQAQQSMSLLAVLLAVLLLLLTLDFVERIWVPRDSAKVAVFTAIEEVELRTTAAGYSAQMQQWLDQLNTQHQANADGSAEAEEAKVLAGARNLTTLRVRVRAVFIRQQPAVALALAELQTLSDGKVQLQRLEQGSEIDGYRVKAIQKGVVVFSQSADPAKQLSVPVFKGENP